MTDKSDAEFIAECEADMHPPRDRWTKHGPLGSNDGTLIRQLEAEDREREQRLQKALPEAIERLKRASTKPPLATTARKSVDYIINFQRFGKNKPRIFIDAELYQRFRDEMLPIYKEKYGALIADQEASEEGWDNILYQGLAICLAPQPKEILTTEEVK